MVDSSLAFTARDRGVHDFYKDVLLALEAGNVPYLIGGAFALWQYTGVKRDTKDLDLFVRRSDWPRIERALGREAIACELTFPHWLGKAKRGASFVDIIFNSGNGLTPVDDAWFEHAREASVYEMTVKICPPEEMLWSKSFVMERERYDGADVAHTLLAVGPALDWARLLNRFGEKWRVLLAHVVLFDFIYPDQHASVPPWVREELLDRAKRDDSGPAPHRCQGTFLSRGQYLVDVERWGFEDARTAPDGTMTREQVRRWTAAIEEEKKQKK